MNDNRTNSEGAQAARSTDEIRAQAAAWFEAMNCSALRPQEAQALRAWLQASPAHARAFRELEQTWRDLALMEDAELWVGAAAEEYVQPGPARLPVWRRPAAWVSALAACFVAAMAITVMLRSQQAAAPVIVAYETDIAETRTVELEDKSTIQLGGDSLVEVRYAPGERNVVLKQGVAWFDVAHDPARPFVVHAAQTRITVVGTAFETWMGADSVRVSVGRGRVKVAADAGGAGPDALRVLDAGDQLIATLAGAMGDVVTFKIDDTLAWRRGRFIYTDAALGAVISDINRYRRPKIEIADPSLRDMRVTAAFGVDGIDGFLSGLTEAEGFRLEQADGQSVLHAD